MQLFSRPKNVFSIEDILVGENGCNRDVDGAMIIPGDQQRDFLLAGEIGALECGTVETLLIELRRSAIPRPDLHIDAWSPRGYLWAS